MELFNLGLIRMSWLITYFLTTWFSKFNQLISHLIRLISIIFLISFNLIIRFVTKISWYMEDRYFFKIRNHLLNEDLFKWKNNNAVTYIELYIHIFSFFFIFFNKSLFKMFWHLIFSFFFIFFSDGFLPLLLGKSIPSIFASLFLLLDLFIITISISIITISIISIITITTVSIITTIVIIYTIIIGFMIYILTLLVWLL